MSKKLEKEILKYEIEVFGEELAKLNSLSLEKRIQYVAQRQKYYNTTKDEIQKMGFPTEYWESLDEIPKELLEMEQESIMIKK